MDELIDIVDETGEPTGKRVMKSTAHTYGIPHRAVHIWIYNDNAEILLQQSALDKPLYPGTWDISAAGHIKAGHEVQETAIREIYEEIGLRVQAQDLQYWRKRHDDTQDNGNHNKEVIFTYDMKWNGSLDELTLQAEEVLAAKWFSTKQLRNRPIPGYELAPHGEFWDELCERVESQTNYG